MRRLLPLLCLPVLLSSGCGEEGTGPVAPDPVAGGEAGAGTEEPEAGDTAPALAALRAHVEELRGRPEKAGLSECTVQHLLVSFQGAGVPGVTRTREEAEALAAELWQRIQAGEDFDALVKQYTDDSHPGIYTMTLSRDAGPGKYPRSGMVPAFGNVGWRLEVGQFGVAAYDPATSKFGWHLIQRTR